MRVTKEARGVIVAMVEEKIQARNKAVSENDPVLKEMRRTRHELDRQREALLDQERVLSEQITEREKVAGVMSWADIREVQKRAERELILVGALANLQEAHNWVNDFLASL